LSQASFVTCVVPVAESVASATRGVKLSRWIEGSALIWRPACKWDKHCGLACIRIVGAFAEF